MVWIEKEWQIRIGMIIVSLIIMFLISYAIGQIPVSNNWYTNPYVMDVK